MKGTITVALTSYLSFISPSFAASVDYQHPNVSIVAVEESLDSVLQAVGKEMKIFVTLPLGLNPTINCDIENKPIDKAFKSLLGNLSYSMQWEEGGERLIGLMIMSDGASSTDTKTTTSVSTSTRNVSPAIGGYTANSPSSIVQPKNVSSDNSAMTSTPESMDHELRMAEQQERHQGERENQEARFREARVAQEARHREARLEEEAQTLEEYQEYMVQEKEKFKNGTPEL